MVTQADMPAVLVRLRDAMNAHDLDALVACFDTDFRSEQPAHPARAFRGNEQVRKNWWTMFHGIPDLQADVLGAVSAGDMAWTEWRWVGTQRDGTPREQRGVIILGCGGPHHVGATLHGGGGERR